MEITLIVSICDALKSTLPATLTLAGAVCGQSSPVATTLVDNGIFSALYLTSSVAPTVATPTVTSNLGIFGGGAGWSVTGTRAYTSESVQVAVSPSSRYVDFPTTLSPEWPRPEQWVSFDTLWSRQLQNSRIGLDCASPVPTNSDGENTDLRAALIANGQDYLVDPRLLLAVTLEHSQACVRINKTSDTGWGAERYGVMGSFGVAGVDRFQCVNGSATITPCNKTMINNMVSQGALNLVMIINSIQGMNTSTTMWHALGQYYGGPNFDIEKAEVFRWMNDIYNTLSGWIYLPGQSL